MKNILKTIIKYIFDFISIFINYRTIQKYNSYKSSVYSYLTRKEFKNIGKHCSFSGDILLLGTRYIKLGHNVTLQRHCIFTAWDKYRNDSFSPYVEIGNNCSFGEYNHVTAINKIVIGNGLLTGRWVTITDNSHGKFSVEGNDIPPMERKLYSNGSVIIGNNVWLGDKVTILPNVTIGNNVTIGANSVVTANIPSNAVAAGNPAKIIKQIISVPF